MYIYSIGDKPFSCSFCDKKFALNCNLKTHLKTHEGLIIIIIIIIIIIDNNR